ncbi:hypothetical protein [Sporolactobacillus spathodeae]|uniref:IDEAL domain-containing protein n=1 Tax=Sporolactobacillus spathodeae TaxID=1465502 RepID=A0ABS2QA49_9BACL|nr:hypothetical protein [Sporolactobacillus spathodeae]MBM7658044.1 hypothetical protein [Sporolactobacillus spathodeae]
MKIGQWVHTKYMGKHECIGFVTAVYPDFKRCKLRVTRCDHYPNMKWLEIAFDDAIDEQWELSSEEFDHLIDLALATYDEDWFHNLVARKRRLFTNY